MEQNVQKVLSLPKICYKYPKIVKPGSVIPYLKVVQKSINHVTQPLGAAEINSFTQ